MATINDIGVPGQPMNNPPLTPWQAAVRDVLGTDLPIDTRFAGRGVFHSALAAHTLTTPGGTIAVGGFTIPAYTGAARAALIIATVAAYGAKERVLREHQSRRRCGAQHDDGIPHEQRVFKSDGSALGDVTPGAAPVIAFDAGATAAAAQVQAGSSISAIVL